MEHMDKNSMFIASNVLNKMQKCLENAYERWLCEKEYEDFKDYKQHFKNRLNELKIKSVQFIKGTKKPFGFQVYVKGYKAQFFITQRKVGWKRLI